jgi:hypothetical protein
MQKFLNTLSLFAIAALTWFYFSQPNNDKPKLAKPPSQTEASYKVLHQYNELEREKPGRVLV